MARDNSHSKLVGYILWLFGFLGAHRFYYGKPITASLYFLVSIASASVAAFFWPLIIFVAPLLVIVGIGWIVDLFLIPGMDDEADYKYVEGRLDYNLSWILLTFLGFFGIHRFYMGKWVSGLIYLCTGGLLGIGYVYDYWTLNEQVSKINSER